MDFRYFGCYRTLRPGAVAAMIFAASAVPRVSRADAPPVHELDVRYPVDGGITAAGAVIWIGAELFKERLAPETCRWCDSVPAVDRAARDAWRWEDTHAA